MTRSTSAFLLGVVLAACGVQEHPHEQSETGAGGVVFKPPPAGDGGAISENVGAGQQSSG